MAHLGEWRKTHQKLKPVIDVVRGILLSFFLVPVPVRKTMYAPHDLYMVGAEIMNRACAAEFQSCSRKLILAPGCMRLRSENACEGFKTEKGIRCTGCESRCHINQLREMGLRDNFDVMIIPHSTDLARWSAKPGEEPTAVVGVACLSVLVEGGWELKRNNVPAQCVLLNQCGCKKHWHDKGLSTEIDLHQLKQLIHPN
jgi:hypothetical protein